MLLTFDSCLITVACVPSCEKVQFCLVVRRCNSILNEVNEKNKGQFLHARLRTCDNEFQVQSFPCHTQKYFLIPWLPAHPLHHLIVHHQLLKLIYLFNNPLLLTSPLYYTRHRHGRVSRLTDKIYIS